MDDFFSLFLESFGEPSSREVVPDATYKKYADLLPESLLSYWKAYGWCSFRNGLIWMVDPEKFSQRGMDWLREIPELRNTEHFVFARSAFGAMYALQSETGAIVRILCPFELVVTKRDFAKLPKDKGRALQTFFASALPRDFDILDRNEVLLFEEALKNLGPLQADEMYGFEPLLVLGGEASRGNLKRLRMDVHLDIMREFSNPVLRLV